MAAPQEQFSNLRLDSSPGSSIEALTRLHERLLNALRLAEQIAGQEPQGSTPQTLAFQQITGCRRSEAVYYLQNAPQRDIRSAVIVWHSQVLRDYLKAYQQQLPSGISFKQHEAKQAADEMRSKAKKAAAAAAGFEPAMAQNYIRTNFCSICKVERNTADAYLSATTNNLAAAVEAFIARHLLHPSDATAEPDTGLSGLSVSDQALVARSWSWTSGSASTNGGSFSAASAAPAGPPGVGSSAPRAVAVGYAAAGQAAAGAAAEPSADAEPCGTLRARFAAAKHNQ